MIIEYENFLTADECQSLIGFGESSNLSLGTTGGVKIGYRKAKVNWLDENEVVTKIKVGVARLSGVDIDKQERLHFVRYVEGGEYKEHTDGEFRQKTALVYLNNGFRGGETVFPKLNRTIKPEIGKLVIWDNIDENGKEDTMSLHTGLPVEVGTKYIAVIWIKK
jgi:prolyl 4-hydroxylase